MRAYYNEIEPFAAQWLRNLIAKNLIAPGEVDERSIVDVKAQDLEGFTQAHFFAGVGVWSHALRCAGWPDNRPIWTGSCPCQPFSVAGAMRGTADERHLWPEFFRLIRECRPATVIGEQVAGPAALAWYDALCADMEGAGYAVGTSDLCAACVGAPHIRQRLYWVADSTSGGQRIDGSAPGDTGHAPQCEPARGMEHPNHGLHNQPEGEDRETNERAESGRAVPWLGGAGSASGVAEPVGGGREESDVSVRQPRQDKTEAVQRGPSYWSSADWVPCADGKARPVEPGTFPLAHGVAGRVGRLRAYGNALCAPVATEFVRAVLRCLP